MKIANPHQVIQEMPECLLLALSGHYRSAKRCPLLGVKRTSAGANPMSAFDPKRTLVLRSSGPLCEPVGSPLAELV
jgi:hypothetical protein